MTKIKLCGITCKEDIKLINKYRPDYMGIVLFCPKSRRNVEIQTARELISGVNDGIKKAAVMVSPTAEQVKAAQTAGFDIVQIHGEITEETYNAADIPIFKAFNVTDTDKINMYNAMDKIEAYVFDAPEPGSGKAFDRNTVKSLDTNGKKTIIAGGLNSDNVKQAISDLHPYAVDVSTGIENDSGSGKSEEKIALFCRQVRG